MKKILGLDLGTNSIGWAVVEIDHEKRLVRIIALGSRIIPMGDAEISKFENGGKLKSSATNKTEYKSIRKNKARFLLRRDRLHCVLNLLQWLPEHYKLDIEFVDEKGKRSGKIIKGKEPKLAYDIDKNGKRHFIFTNAYAEMEKEFKSVHPELFHYNNRSKKQTKIPYDWTLYYLRKKGLSQELTKEELAWVTMSFLQKRGYEKVMGKDEKEQKEGEISETINAKVVSVELLPKKSQEGLNLYHIKLADESGNIVFEYDEDANYQVTQLNEFKLLEKISKLGKDNDEIITKVEICISEIKSIEIIDIINTHERRKENTIFKYYLATGWSPEFSSRYSPKLKGAHRDFVITSTFDQKGLMTKKRNITMPNEDSDQLIKLKTETSIKEFNSINKTVGVASYIYSALLRNPNQKIKAGLVETIDRDSYEDELRAILNVQKLFHPELRDKQKYMDALWMLYPNNESHRNALAKRDYTALLGDDIIFYQRDLKTKKSQIANCKYEYVTFKKDGKEEKKPLKCIAKSNPLYQEFRLWKFIKCLKIIQLESENEHGEKLINVDVSNKYLTTSAKEELFEWLNNKKEVTQSALLRKLKLDESNFIWSYEADHKEPCNETRYEFVLRLKRIKNFDWNKFLNAKSKVHTQEKINASDSDCLVDGPSNEYLLWHFFYSVRKKDERIKGLPSLIEKLLNNAGIDLSYKNKVTEMISSISTYKSNYGKYSEKAIKKLLPFMRLGKYWKQEDVERINTVFPIKPEVLIKENINGEITDLQGLSESSACYIVYGRYSEVADETHWTQPKKIKEYLLNEFKHNSINNPVVEKVLRETLMVVHDIWTTFGEEMTFINDDGKEEKTYKKYFDQINIEIGTSLKKNTKQKERDSKKNAENKRANERAIAMLKELKATYKGRIKDGSPSQLLKMRLLESGAIEAIKYDKDDTIYEYKENTNEKTFTKKELSELLKKEVSKITANEILRYRLWLEQRYISPYTGVPISLSKLFDPEEYQVDHIFPQERITFDSITNKVLCEAWANQAKGARTGYEFILDCKGKVRYGGILKAVLSPEDYVNHITTTFFDPEKKEILLSKNIPNKFGNNQLNNTRYIAKLAMELLSNIVREEGEKDLKSKNVLVISGGITSRLKKDWQLDDAWNELIRPRFVHLNKLLETEAFINPRKINGHEIDIPIIPTEKVTICGEMTCNQPKDIIPFDINKKRIDHRHHALDALIVALATSNHVNYINNQTGSDFDINSNQRIGERKDLKAKYMTTKLREDGTKIKFFLPPMQYKEGDKTITYKYTYKNLVPQAIFKDVVVLALQNTLATFKQKNHIMRQRTNWIIHPDHKKRLPQKDLKQKRNYSIRQSLHESTFYGKRLFRPIPIENALNKPELIIENRIKQQIQALSQEGLSKDQIVQKMKETDSVVYIKEACAVTQWNECHSINILAKSDKSKIIKEIECAVDICVQNILKRHLAKYDSVELTVSEARLYYDDIVYEEQRAIVDEYLKNGKESEKKIYVFARDKEFGDKPLTHNPQLAFSIDGIEEMNNHITELNNGKSHKPIYRVKFAQTLGKMFPVTEPEDSKPVTVKTKQFVCTNKGSNIVCGIYKSDKGETKIFVPTLRDVIDARRNGKEIFPETYPDPEYFDFKFKFTLSPLDMVYMPTKDEIETGYLNDDIVLSRIYIMNNVDENHIYFKPYNIAAEIIKNEIDLQRDKKGRLIGSRECKTANCDGLTIKDYCIPIKVDRLGNIIEINGKKV